MQGKSFPRNYPMKGKNYLDICKDFLDRIEEGQGENFKKAGQIIGNEIMDDGIVHVIGTGGHACLPAYDMFYRAGGLVPINYIIPIGALYGAAGATHGMRIERTPGYMKQVIDYYHVKSGDVALVFNNIGVNAATIDAALACKEKGATVIGIGGSVWQEEIPKGHYTRHPSNKNLKDIVDLFIDDYNPVGDAVVQLEGFDRPIAPISNITDAYIVRRIEIEAIKYMLGKGFTPPVWVSANVPGGDEANKKYQEEYYCRVKLL
ncbi:sugar isomerase domain-containing protein [Patescibacteria group bacterium]|nr:sugar isomerase domain-containing protein [Patescibacteria group bacterium]